MSHLGDEIRQQQRAAQHLCDALEDDTRTLQQRVAGTTWESGAGDFFRTRLQELVQDLSEARCEVVKLVEDLGRHATKVEERQHVVAAIAHLPIDQAQGLLETTGHVITSGAHGAADLALEGLHLVGAHR